MYESPRFSVPLRQTSVVPVGGIPDDVVWGAPSRFVQVTVVPTEISRSCSTNLIMSVFTSRTWGPGVDVAGTGVTEGGGSVADCGVADGWTTVTGDGVADEGIDVAVNVAVDSTVAVGTAVDVGGAAVSAG